MPTALYSDIKIGGSLWSGVEAMPLANSRNEPFGS
jgi:hypothetical protein